MLQAVFLVDTKGLITDSRGDEKPEHKKVFMRTDGTPDMKVRARQGTCVKRMELHVCKRHKRVHRSSRSSTSELPLRAIVNALTNLLLAVCRSLLH